MVEADTETLQPQAQQHLEGYFQDAEHQQAILPVLCHVISVDIAAKCGTKMDDDVH